MNFYTNPGEKIPPPAPIPPPHPVLNNKNITVSKLKFADRDGGKTFTMNEQQLIEFMLSSP